MLVNLSSAEALRSITHGALRASIAVWCRDAIVFAILGRRYCLLPRFEPLPEYIPGTHTVLLDLDSRKDPFATNSNAGSKYCSPAGASCGGSSSGNGYFSAFHVSPSMSTSQSSLLMNSMYFRRSMSVFSRKAAYDVTAKPLLLLSLASALPLLFPFFCFSLFTV